MPVETSIQVLFRAMEVRNSENQVGPVVHLFDAFSGLQLPSGTAAGQADVVFSDRRNLGAGLNESLDLAGSLLGVFGTTLTFAKVKAFLLYNRTAGQVLSYKGGVTNGWVNAITTNAADIVRIPGGGFFIWYDPTGATVTAGTADIINIANSAPSACDYDIFVLGTSV